MESIWAEQALLSEGWARDVRLTLQGTRIARIEAGVPMQAGEARVDTLLPAPANLHSHAFQRAMAGMTEKRGPGGNDSFWTWRQLMFAFLDQITPDDVQAIAAFVQMQMLEAGYGASVEFHYLHHAPGGTPYVDPAEMSARIVAAAAQSGIGLTLLPVLYQQGGCDGRALGPGQVRFGNDIDGFVRVLEGAGAAMRALPGDSVLGVAPHSLRAVTRQGLQQIALLRPDAPIHLHLAEQRAEVDEVQAAYGAHPVDWLLANAAIDGRWCLIHCTQMHGAQTRALAATGAVAGLCPITESSLGDGIFDGVTFTQARGRWGIGSDSNIRITLTEELRVLDHSQRLRDKVRAPFAAPGQASGRVLLEGAALGGAQAAGRDSGRLAPGAQADLLALSRASVDLEGRTGDAVLDAWIFAADDRAVDSLWSGGRRVVRGGRHIAHDAIEAAYRRVIRRLQVL